MSTYSDMAAQGLKGTWWLSKNLAINSTRRGLILGRHILGAWQQRRLNKAMNRLGSQFFTALEQGETNPLVVSAVSDAVQKAKDLKALKDKNCQAMEIIRARIRATWKKEAPPPGATPEAAAPEPEEALEAEQAMEPEVAAEVVEAVAPEAAQEPEEAQQPAEAVQPEETVKSEEAEKPEEVVQAEEVEKPEATEKPKETEKPQEPPAS